MLGLNITKGLLSALAFIKILPKTISRWHDKIGMALWIILCVTVATLSVTRKEF